MLAEHSTTHAQEPDAQEGAPVDASADPALAPAIKAPTPPRDPVERYTRYEYNDDGTIDRSRPRDRRIEWASEEVAAHGRHRMTKGELRARRTYFRRMADKRFAADKAAAVAYALGLHHGPLPGVQTEAEFAAYWTRARLTTIALAWDLRPVGAYFAAAQMRTARDSYLREAPQIAHMLIEAGRNENVPWTARINALLGAARLASEACPTTVDDLGLPPLIAENWDEILALLPQIAARIPDAKRAEMIMGAIREWLAVTKPVEKPLNGPRRVVFEHQVPAEQHADPLAPAIDDDEDVPPPPPPPNAVDHIEDPTLPSVTHPDDADDIEGLINEIVVGDAKVVG